MLSLRVEEKFGGPTIIEMESLLAWGDGVFEVRWEGSKTEIHLAKKHADLGIALVVPTLAAMERAASALGLPFTMDRSVMVNGMTTLNKPDGRWRDFSYNVGPQVARGAVMRALANAMRKGEQSSTLQRTVVQNILDQVQPADLDVLYAMRLRGARV